MPNTHVEFVSPTSPLFELVKQLGRAQSSTLGFLPAGAFQDYAARGQILVATGKKGVLLGYLLYRISREMAFVVHLCVAPEHRDKKVATSLNEALLENCKHLRGIQLRCRRDYPANNMWPKLGYHIIDEVPGRGKDPKPVVVWRIDHGHPDLFSEMDKGAQAGNALKVALDANIFYDLDDQNDDPHDESLPLKGDWLEEFVQFFVTGELLNEINKQEDPAVRDHHRKRARSYEQALCDQPRLNERIAALENLIGKPKNDRDEADLRHLAYASESGCRVFLTRDQRLLDRCETCSDKLDITVLRPWQLIVRLDELQRRNEYEPARFSGTILSVGRVRHDQEHELVEVFQRDDLAENKKGFRKVLAHLMTEHQTTEAYCVKGSDDEPLALYALEEADSRTMRVSLFRVRRGTGEGTLFRHLVFKMLEHASDRGMRRVLVSEPRLPPLGKQVLAEDYFTQTADGWERILLPKLLLIGEAKSQLNELASLHPKPCGPAKDATDRAAELNGNAAALSHVEHLLWPLKLADATIPTFIVPIQYRWAVHLFDEELAREELFGADESLAFNREGVYYRSARPRISECPARILWYVSKGPKMIRACSRLTAIRIAGPKDLFREFERLGVYQWRDVFECANHDISKEIMAMRFDDTVRFRSPVPWAVFQPILKKANCPSFLQSPHRVPPEVFAEIYRKGMEGYDHA